MTKDQAVRFFGSAAKLAKAIGLTPDAVVKWVEIPDKRKRQVIDAMKAERAQRKKVDELLEKLMNAQGKN